MLEARAICTTAVHGSAVVFHDTGVGIYSRFGRRSWETGIRLVDTAVGIAFISHY